MRESPGPAPPLFRREPRNCFCVDQCLSRRPSLARHQQTPPSHRHHSSPASSPGASPRPRLPQAQYYEDRPCFTWDGAEPDDQLSTYPPEGTPAAHFATYYSFKSSGGAGKIGREEYLAKRKDRSHIVLANVEQCPAQCSGEGNCLAPWEGAAPGCACFFGRAGGSCEVAVKELTCYGACSGAPPAGRSPARPCSGRGPSALHWSPHLPPDGDPRPPPAPAQATARASAASAAATPAGSASTAPWT